MQLSEQEIIRREKLTKLREMGINPYPADLFPVDATSKSIKKDYSEGKKVIIAGRLMSRRIQGKASFAELQDSEGRIQVYFNRDEICPNEDKTLYNDVYKKLLDIGCPAVMPLAAPIGSGLGVQNPANLKIMREQLPDATIIVDAGVGVPSDAAIAMELGADAILMNTAIAEANDAEQMGLAMNYAVKAGRLAYRSGRMPKRLYASASSPIEGAIK